MRLDIELDAFKLHMEKYAKEFVEAVRRGDEHDPIIKERVQEAFRAKQDGEFLSQIKLERDAYERACFVVVQRIKLY